MPSLRIEQVVSEFHSRESQLELIDALTATAHEVIQDSLWWNEVQDDSTHVLAVDCTQVRFYANSSSIPKGQTFSAEQFSLNRPFTQLEQNEFRHWLTDQLYLVADETIRTRRESELHRLLREVERYVYEVDLAIQENMSLRLQVESARIEIEFLRHQLAQVTEALKVDHHPRLTRAMLAGVGAILLAVTTGAAEATSSGLFERSEKLPSVAENYVERCDTLTHQLELLDPSLTRSLASSI